MATDGNEEIINWYKRVEKQEERVIKLEANVFQLANYYFVFQGVIFTAIFGAPSTLKCHYRLVPFSLSLTAALLNLMVLYGIANKYAKALRRLEDDYSGWYRQPRQADRRQANNIEVLIPADYDRRRQERQQYHYRTNRIRKCGRKTVLIACMAFFVVFAGINLYATWCIPCYQPATNNTPSVP